MSDSDVTLLTVKEACGKLRVSQNTAYNLLSTKKLQGFKVGRTWRIPSNNLKEYIDKQLVEEEGGTQNEKQGN